MTGPYLSYAQSRQLLTMVLLLVAHSCVAQTPQPTSPKTPATPTAEPSLKVMYTGKLLGYYREPVASDSASKGSTQQSCLSSAFATGGSNYEVEVRKCDVEVEKNPGGSLDHVSAFYEWRSYQKKKAPPTVLLGMGDNFAPDLPARMRPQCFVTKGDIGWRMLAFDSPPTGSPASKDSRERRDFPLKAVPLKDCVPGRDLIAEGKAPEMDDDQLTFAAEDNVANFFMKAGYDAIVPGREDFLYGAPWIHAVASRLKKQSLLEDQWHAKEDVNRQPIEQQVQMLAANLHYASSKDQAEAYHLVPNQPACPLFLGAITPDKAQVALSCNTRRQAAAEDQAGVGYKIIRLQDADGKPVNVLVVGIVGNDFLREISDANKTFQVVGVKLPANSKAKLSDTFQLVVTNPMTEVEAILAQADKDAHDGHFTINRRVLMAQMSRAEALEFSSQFGSRAHLHPPKALEVSKQDDSEKKGLAQGPVLLVRPSPTDEEASEPGFDLVLSEAEQTNATQNEETVYGSDNRLDQDAADLAVLKHYELPQRNKIRAYLATPHPTYDPGSNRLVSPLSAVTIDSEITKISSADQRTLDPSGQTERVLSRIHNDAFAFDLDDAGASVFEINGNPRTKGVDWLTAKKDEVTRVLAEQAKANLALIQDRDLFDKVVRSESNYNEVCGKLPTAECVAAAKEEIVLWKHDGFVMVNLSGTQLSTVLANSQYLSELEFKGLQGDAAGEWVRPFGIAEPSASREAGTVRFFDVAFGKECLATPPAFPGTTAAPATAKASGPSTTPTTFCIDGVPIQPSRLYSVATTRAIANNNELFAGINPPAAGTAVSLSHPDQIREFLAKNVFQQNDRTSIDPGFEKSITDEQSPSSKAVKSQQEEGHWHLNIPTWTASYTQYRPNNTDASLGTLYGAATDTRASAAHSSDFEWSQNVRFLHEGQYFSFGPTFTQNVSKKVTGSASGDAINYGSNSVAPAWITEFNLGNPFVRPVNTEKTKLLPQLRLANTMLFQTQMFGPIVNVTCDNPAGGCKVPLIVDRQRAFIARFGVRQDLSNDSYAEMGYQYGINTHVLQQVAIVNGGSTTAVCDLTTQTLSQCVTGYQKPLNGSVPATPIITAGTILDGHYRPRQFQGFYVDSQSVVTLSGWAQQKLKLYTKVQGDYWGDRNSMSQSTVQTKYDFVTAIGLQVPIRGNLSLMPAYQVYFYENMNLYKPVVGKTINVSLTWSFDWHSPVNILTNATYLTTTPGTGAQNPLLPTGSSAPSGNPLPK